MSPHLQEPSVEELRRDSERTRVHLTNTVEELRGKVSDTVTDVKNRVSPMHIKEQIKDYARDNPLQAVAIGAGLAYPLWSIIRNIPAPIMLIGAGLFLAKKGRGPIGESLAVQAKNKAADLNENVTERASELATKIQDAAIHSANRIGETVADASAAVTSDAKSMVSKVADVASDAKSAAAGIGKDVVAALQSTTTTVLGSASQTVSMAKEKAIEVSGKSRDAIMDIVERNPLLVAGVGLAIGAFIAASLPPSGAENRLFGERSDELKEQARKAASKGVEHAKDVAADVVGDVAAAAAREGLSVEGVREAVAELTEGVKSVADRGIKAALGGESASVLRNSTQPYKS